MFGDPENQVLSRLPAATEHRTLQVVGAVAGVLSLGRAGFGLDRSGVVERVRSGWVCQYEARYGEEGSPVRARVSRLGWARLGEAVGAAFGALGQVRDGLE